MWSWLTSRWGYWCVSQSTSCPLWDDWQNKLRSVALQRGPSDDLDFGSILFKPFSNNSTFILPPSVKKRDGGMAKLVFSVCFLTNTLLVDSTYWWTEIKPMKPLLSLWCFTLSHYKSLMGKWNLNPLCSPESEWPEAAEGRKPLALPWCWESRRDLVAGSKRQPHTQGRKKLEYIVESCSGRSRICQEMKRQKTALDPFCHLTRNSSYRIFPRSQQHFLGWKSKACTCCWQCLFRNPAVSKCS